MKKLLSIAISVLLLITAVTPALASTEVAYDGASVILSGAVEGAPEGAVSTIIVVKPDEDGNEVDITEVLDAKSTEEYLELIEYVGIVKLDENGSFSEKYTINLKESLPSGTCGIYVNYLGQNELVKLGDFYHINADELNALVKSFNGDDADYSALLTEDNLFILSRIGVDSEKYGSIVDKVNFGKILKSFAPFEDGKPNKDMSAALNFSVSFNEALSLQEVKESGELVMDVLGAYNGKYWTLPLDKDDDINKIPNKTELLEDIKDADFTRGSILEKSVKEKIGLSVFEHMCNQKSDIGDFIKNYGTVFGLDVELYEDESLTDYDRVDICTYILENKDDIKDAETMADVYNDAFDSLEEDEDDSASSGNSRPSGGGGGSSYKPPVVEVNKETEKEQIKPLTFNDVAVTHWAYDYISRLYNEGVVAGKNEKTFSPDASITKEEFIKLVVSALKLDISKKTSDFADVNADAWYAPYVTAAVNAGLISGKSDGTFGIGDTLSRQDAAVILSRALASKSDTEVAFADKGDIAPYALDSIAVMNASGIINGYTDGTFKPMNSISRAESCAVLCRLLDKKGGAK